MLFSNIMHTISADKSSWVLVRGNSACLCVTLRPSGADRRYVYLCLYAITAYVSYAFGCCETPIHKQTLPPVHSSPNSIDQTDNLWRNVREGCVDFSCGARFSPAFGGNTREYSSGGEFSPNSIAHTLPKCPATPPSLRWLPAIGRAPPRPPAGQCESIISHLRLLLGYLGNIQCM